MTNTRHIPWLAAILVALVITLSGCAGASDEGAQDNDTPAAQENGSGGDDNGAEDDARDDDDDGNRDDADDDGDD